MVGVVGMRSELSMRSRAEVQRLGKVVRHDVSSASGRMLSAA